MQPLLIKIHQCLSGDSLQKNANLLMLSQLVSTGAGFLFWIICAHAFRPSQIGFATSLISYAGLAATFTSFGLSSTLIRFLPTSKQQGGLFSGSILAVLIASIVGGIVEIMGLHLFAPRLAFVSSSILLSVMLIVLVAGSNISALMDSVLLSFKQAKTIFWKATYISALKLVLPFIVIGFGLKGLLSIYACVFWLGIIYSLFVVLRILRPKQSLRPTLGELAEHRAYSVSNYLGGLFGMLPGTLAPIIILSKLGPANAAYYYMPAQIAAFLSLLSSSVSQALIAETAQTDDPTAHRALFLGAVRHLYLLMIPAICCILAAGWFVLHIYGSNYAARGFAPLVVLTLSSLFIGVNWLGDTWLNIQKRHTAYFYMNAFNALAVVAGIYALSGKGLMYAALGALFGQAVSALVYVAIFARDQLFPSAAPVKTLR